MTVPKEIPPRPIQRRTWASIGPDVLAFAIGLAIAWVGHWKTTDLVWSLWLGSLTLGYLTILSTLAAGTVVGIKVVSHDEFPRRYRLPAILGGTGLALVLLAFFSFHFCAFHAGHAGFLSVFFPLEGLSPETFFDAFTNPFRLWKTAFRHLLPLYGAFLVPAIIAERSHVFAAIAGALKAVNERTPPDAAKQWFAADPERQKAVRDPFVRPYLNVVRMHLLIFFFAFCHAVGLESFWVFSAVYFVYFFPWSAFRREGPTNPPQSPRESVRQPNPIRP